VGNVGERDTVGGYECLSMYVFERKRERNLERWREREI